MDPCDGVKPAAAVDVLNMEALTVVTDREH